MRSFALRDMRSTDKVNASRPERECLVRFRELSRCAFDSAWLPWL